MIFKPTEPQEMMVKHFAKNKTAAAFVGCGLGKTAASLFALNELFHDGAIDGALIVAEIRKYSH